MSRSTSLRRAEPCWSVARLSLDGNLVRFRIVLHMLAAMIARRLTHYPVRTSRACASRTTARRRAEAIRASPLSGRKSNIALQVSLGLHSASAARASNSQQYCWCGLTTPSADREIRGRRNPSAEPFRPIIAISAELRTSTPNSLLLSFASPRQVVVECSETWCTKSEEHRASRSFPSGFWHLCTIRKEGWRHR